MYPYFRDATKLYRLFIIISLVLAGFSAKISVAAGLTPPPSTNEVIAACPVIPTPEPVLEESSRSLELSAPALEETPPPADALMPALEGVTASSDALMPAPETPAPAIPVQVRLEVEPSVANPGDLVTYTLTLTNTGDGLLTDLLVNAVFAPELTYTPTDAASEPKGQYSPESYTLRYTLDGLKAGETIVLNFQARLAHNATGNLACTVFVGADPAQAPGATAFVQAGGVRAVRGADTGSGLDAGWTLLYNPPVVAPFSGAATYNYELDLPPGRNGLKPGVKLSYSSRAVDGVTYWVDSEWVGMGWSIDTIDIARRRVWYTFGNEGNYNWLDLSREFSLVINGTSYRLIPAAGVTFLGRYYAEDAPELYVELTTGSAANLKSDYWIVRTPNGDRYRLGYNADSEQTVWPVYCSPNTECMADPDTHRLFQVYRWRVDEVTNSFNNRMVFDYVEYRTTFSGSVYREYASYPANIRYNSYEGGWASRIEFVSSEVGVPPGHDPPVFRTHRQLNAVRAYHLGQLMREYVLAYESETHANVSIERRLTRIQQCGAGGVGGACLPPVTLTYQDYPNKSWELGGHQDRCNLDASPKWPFTDGTPCQYWGEQFPYPRLVRVDNGYGATTVFTYSEPFRSANRSEKYYTVIQAQEWDGAQSVYPDATAPRITYEYVGGCWDSSNQGCDIPNQDSYALIGFFQTTERHQKYEGAAWRDLAATVHQFDNTNYRTMGRETQTRRLDAADAVLQQMDRIWGVTTGNSGYVFLSEERQTDYSGGVRTSTRSAYTYDEYANPKAAYQYGAEEPVVNAGFEQAGDWWVAFPTPTPASVTYAESFAGRGSLQLQGATNGGMYQDVAGLTPGETYVVRVWVKGSAQATAQFQIWLTDVTGTPFTPTTAWTQQTLSFVANTTGQVRIHLYYLAGSGTVFVDEVALARAQDVGDESSTHRFFFNLTDYNRWLIGLKWGQNLFAGITLNVSGSRPKLQTIWYYDDADHDPTLWGHSEQITRGLVTMIGQGLLSPPGQPFATTRFVYDPIWGILTSVIDPNDSVTLTTYDSTYHMFPTEVCRAAGVSGVAQCSHTEHYGVGGVAADYGLPGLVKRVIDPNEQPTEYRYDTFGRLTKVVRPGDSAAMPTTEYMYRDGYHLWIWNGKREQSGQAGMLDSEVFYDGQGRAILTRVEATDGNWIVTSTEYDTLGNVARQYEPQLHHPQVQVYEAERDFNHRRGSAQGSVWVSPNVTTNHNNPEFLSFGLYQVPAAEGPGQKACFSLAIDVVAGNNDTVAVAEVYDTTANQFLARQDLKRTDFVGGLANMSEFCLAFNSSGRLTHLLDYRVYWPDYAKVAHDRVTIIWDQRTAADAPHTLTQYDALGRVVRSVGPDGSASERAYVGRTTIAMDANGHRRDGVADAFGRPAAALEYVGGASDPLTTRYTYDVQGNLTQVVDAAGNVTTMTYAPPGRKVALSDPDMGQWSYSYDDAGNLIGQTDALSQTITFEYDALNRLVSKREADGDVLTEYTYDAFDPAAGQYGRGLRTGMTDASGSTVWTYDQRGRLTAETKTINGFGVYVTRFTYDAADRVVTMTYPDGEVIVNHYDSRGELDSMARQDGAYVYVENVDYNALGQVALIELGPADLNLRTNHSYNAANARLESLVTTGPTGLLQNLSYTHDAVGNVWSITDGMNGGQVQNFRYDALDRLVHAWTTGGGQGVLDETYAYDAIGNITAKNDVIYYYDPHHPHAAQTLAYGPTQLGSYAYDANGSMITRNDNGSIYGQSYNVENRLASVTTSSATTTFTYDGAGQRVKKVESNGATTAYVGDYYEVSYPPPPGKLVTGKLTNVGNAWQTVTLPYSYSSMVVVASPSYDSGDAPAVVRVRNAANRSFQVKVQNPSDQPLSGYTVHYLVVEAGVYTQAQHGVKMEAVRYSSTVTDRATSWVGQRRSYQQTYVNPIVLGQVMTVNDPDWSVFWARGASQGNPPIASALYTGKHVGEDADTTRNNETIGYIVIESGSGNIGDLAYIAALGPDSVGGMDNTPPFPYAISGLSAARVAVVSATAMDGGDGGWPVLYGDDAVSASQLKLVFDEDQTADVERSHLPEEVPYIVFSGVKTLPPLGVKATKYYYANGKQVAMRVISAGSDVVYYLHGDHLGSTSLVTTGTPVLVGGVPLLPGFQWSRQLYTPYGETRWSSGAPPTDVQFTGQRNEQNLGLYDYNARFYDPFLGRFICADTIVPEPGNPQALNRYSYALGNPFRYTDPTGHYSREEIMAAFGVSTWEQVLAFFMEGGPLEGRWGWLEILRRAHDFNPIEGWGEYAWVAPGAVAPDPHYTAMIFRMDGQIVIGWAYNLPQFFIDPNAINSYVIIPPDPPVYRPEFGHIDWANRFTMYRLPGPHTGMFSLDEGFETNAFTIHYHLDPVYDPTPIYERPEDMFQLSVSGAAIGLELTGVGAPIASGITATQVAVAASNIAGGPPGFSSNDVLDVLGAVPYAGVVADGLGMTCVTLGVSLEITP